MDINNDGSKPTSNLSNLYTWIKQYPDIIPLEPNKISLNGVEHYVYAKERNRKEVDEYISDEHNVVYNQNNIVIIQTDDYEEIDYLAKNTGGAVWTLQSKHYFERKPGFSTIYIGWDFNMGGNDPKSKFIILVDPNDEIDTSYSQYRDGDSIMTTFFLDETKLDEGIFKNLKVEYKEKTIQFVKHVEETMDYNSIIDKVLEFEDIESKRWLNDILGSMFGIITKKMFNILNGTSIEPVISFINYCIEKGLTKKEDKEFLNKFLDKVGRFLYDYKNGGVLEHFEKNIGGLYLYYKKYPKVFTTKWWHNNNFSAIHNKVRTYKYTEIVYTKLCKKAIDKTFNLFLKEGNNTLEYFLDFSTKWYNADSGFYDFLFTYVMRTDGLEMTHDFNLAKNYPNFFEHYYSINISLIYELYKADDKLLNKEQYQELYSKYNKVIDHTLSSSNYSVFYDIICAYLDFDVMIDITHDGKGFEGFEDTNISNYIESFSDLDNLYNKLENKENIVDIYKKISKDNRKKIIKEDLAPICQNKSWAEFKTEYPYLINSVFTKDTLFWLKERNIQSYENTSGWLYITSYTRTEKSFKTKFKTKIKRLFDCFYDLYMNADGYNKAETGINLKVFLQEVDKIIFESAQLFSAYKTLKKVTKEIYTTYENDDTVSPKNAKKTFVNTIVAPYLDLDHIDNVNSEHIDDVIEIHEFFNAIYDINSIDYYIRKLYERLYDDDNLNDLFEIVKEKEIDINIEDYIEDIDNLDEDKFVENLYPLWNATLKETYPSTDLMYYIFSQNEPEGVDTFHKKFIESIGLKGEDDGEDDYEIFYSDITDLDEFYTDQTPFDVYYDDDVDYNNRDSDQSWDEEFDRIKFANILEIYLILKNERFSFDTNLNTIKEWDKRYKDSMKAWHGTKKEDYESKDEYYRISDIKRQFMLSTENEISELDEFKHFRSEVESILRHDTTEENDEIYPDMSIDISDITNPISWGVGEAYSAAKFVTARKSLEETLTDVFTKWKNGEIIKWHDNGHRLRIDPWKIMKKVNLKELSNNHGDQFTMENILTEYFDTSGNDNLSFNDDHLYGDLDDIDFDDYITNKLDHIDYDTPSLDSILENKIINYKNF